MISGEELNEVIQDVTPGSVKHAREISGDLLRELRDKTGSILFSEHLVSLVCQWEMNPKEIPQSILNGYVKRAEKYAKEYEETFGLKNRRK